MSNQRAAFTLIEVLVAVMIISVVIGALMQLFSTNSHTFASVESKILQTNKTTLLLGNTIYGFEDKKIDLAELVKDFNIDDDLRRKLKDQKAEIFYREVKNIDFGDAADSIAEAQQGEEENGDEALVTDATDAANSIEVGRTTLKLNGESSSFLRVKIQ